MKADNSSEQNLSQLIDLEHAKLVSALKKSKTPYQDLISLIRQLDVFYVSLYSGGLADRQEGQKRIEIYQYGWFDAFSNYLPQLKSNEYPFVFDANDQAQRWADSVLTVAGKIAFSTRHLDAAKAGLIEILQTSEKNFVINFKHEIFEKEHYDRESFDFVKKANLNMAKKKNEEHTKKSVAIQRAVERIIQNPYGKYISYQATEEIENYYAKAGYFHMVTEQGYEEFGEDDLFGGIPYKDYLDCVEDILTYTWDIERRNQNYARHFGMSREVADQILSCLTLSSENLSFYKDLKGSLPAPYIQTGKNQYARSIFGALHGTIDFLKRELKRRYEKDYFNAVNKREKRFRDNIYVFFPGDRFLKINKEIILKYDGLHTDIDAIIFDVKTNSLGLFQLKWQDVYYTSHVERRSRISNLFPKATEWIDKIEKWVSDFPQEEIIKKLTLDKYQVKELGEVYLFVITRNHVHFTGVNPDDRAAWGSLNQIPFSMSRFDTSFDDPIHELHLKLKMDAPEERVKREGVPEFKRFKLALESFSIT